MRLRKLTTSRFPLVLLLAIAVYVVAMLWTLPRFRRGRHDTDQATLLPYTDHPTRVAACSSTLPAQRSPDGRARRELYDTLGVRGKQRLPREEAVCPLQDCPLAPSKGSSAFRAEPLEKPSGDPTICSLVSLLHIRAMTSRLPSRLRSLSTAIYYYSCGNPANVSPDSPLERVSVARAGRRVQQGHPGVAGDVQHARAGALGAPSLWFGIHACAHVECRV